MSCKTGISEDDVQFVSDALDRHGRKIPNNFEQTAQPFTPHGGRERGSMPRSDSRNPQTENFLEMLGLPYNLHYGNEKRQYRVRVCMTGPHIMQPRFEAPECV